MLNRYKLRTQNSSKTRIACSSCLLVSFCARLLVSKFNYYWLFICLFAHISHTAISERFVADSGIATNTSNESLWENPSGIAFLQGHESRIGYLFESNLFGHRHHANLTLATNLFKALALGIGIKTRAMHNKPGTELTGILGLALSLGSTSLGISFLKTHNFLESKSRGTMISFGFQSRLNKYLALGGLYQEVHDGYFKAPILAAGLGIRALKDYFTLSFDSRWTPKGENFSDSFTWDPKINLQTQFAGIGLNFGVQVPRIMQGFQNIIYNFGFDINFSHLGFSFAGLVNSPENSYGLGGALRFSSARWPSIYEEKNTWVELNMDSDGTAVEHKSNLSRLFTKETSSLSILALLKRIKHDKKIEGLIIRINGFNFGDARAQEWRNALIALKQAGKQIIIFLESPSERDYYIATAANKIYINPQTSISLSRFQKTLVYFADLLENIGVKAEAIAAGNYKTAPRVFTHTHPQKEELEIYTNILVDFWNNFIQETSLARNIPQEKLIEIFNQGEITASLAQELKLVDEAIYYDQIKNSCAQNIISYASTPNKQISWEAPKKVVVIPIDGEIIDGHVSPTLLPVFSHKTGAQDVIDKIEEALDDSDVLGIIIRINSPGGSSSAGSAIYRALLTAREHKPIVASMSDVAASAGYLIASGTNNIIAERNTITGSIGVFSLYFSGEKLAKKIGVNNSELSVTKNPEPSYFHELSAKQRREAQKLVDWTYQNFISSVALGLDLPEQDIKKVADGHVWLGHEAFSRKLVQEIGGFAQALDSLKKLTNLDEQEEIILEIRTPASTNIFSLDAGLANFFNSKSALKDLTKLKAPAEPYLKALDYYRLHGVVQARLPFTIMWE